MLSLLRLKTSAPFSAIIPWEGWPMTNRQKSVSRRRPRVESLECRKLLSTIRFAMDASAPADPRRVAAEVGALPTPHPSDLANHPVTEAVDNTSTATFIDPTAVIHNARAITIGAQVYIGPFATMSARRGATISIGNSSNVQDSVAIRAAGRHGGVVIGDQAILAHNASVIGPATIGAPGALQRSSGSMPSSMPRPSSPGRW